MTYGNIVVGTDGSATAERAVVQAATLAAADGARLIIVTAYTPGQGPAHDVDVDKVPEDIRFMLTDRVQAEELGIKGRAAAKDFAADLIVVGSRGLASHAHFILGSVAASVAHHAPCDVLVAHTTG